MFFLLKEVEPELVLESIRYGGVAIVQHVLWKQ